MRLPADQLAEWMRHEPDIPDREWLREIARAFGIEGENAKQILQDALMANMTRQGRETDGAIY